MYICGLGNLWSPGPVFRDRRATSFPGSQWTRSTLNLDTYIYSNIFVQLVVLHVELPDRNGKGAHGAKMFYVFSNSRQAVERLSRAILSQNGYYIHLLFVDKH